MGVFFYRALILALAGALVSCGGGDDSSGGGGVCALGGEFGEWQEAQPDGLDRSQAGLGLENPIVITLGSAEEPENPYEDVEIERDGQHFMVRINGTGKEYNIVASGEAANGSLKIYGEYKIGLYLNGASISNPKGPAINIQNGKRISVHVVGGAENFLSDGKNYDAPPGDEQAKGAFFSEGQLVFSGSGHLEVASKYNHAIVSDDFISIEGGNIKISEAANDGIHANDKISIKGGAVMILSAGDAMQSERAGVEISGGKVFAAASGNGSKGIKSHGFLSVSGGEANIKTCGSRLKKGTDDESSATGVKANANMEVSGGSLTVKTTGAQAKGINADGDFSVKGGDIHVEATDDGIKTAGNFIMSGGTVYSKSAKKKGIDCKGDVCELGEAVAEDGGSSGGF